MYKMSECKIIQTHEFLATNPKKILVCNVRERSHPWKGNSCDFFPQTETHGKHKIMQFRPTGNRVRIQARETREIGLSFICVHSPQWRNRIPPRFTNINWRGWKICFSVVGAWNTERELRKRFCHKINLKLSQQLYGVYVCTCSC